MDKASKSPNTDETRNNRQFTELWKREHRREQKTTWWHTGTWSCNGLIGFRPMAPALHGHMVWSHDHGMEQHGKAGGGWSWRRESGWSDMAWHGTKPWLLASGLGPLGMARNPDCKAWLLHVWKPRYDFRWRLVGMETDDGRCRWGWLTLGQVWSDQDWMIYSAIQTLKQTVAPKASIFIQRHLILQLRIFTVLALGYDRKLSSLNSLLQYFEWTTFTLSRISQRKE